MIVTVTMNPAIDKTIDVEHLERGGLNRIQHVELDAGGKGINVSKTIHELGGKSVVTGFVAGNTGKIIHNVMKEWNIESDFIEVAGETRTNTKVFEKTGELTELNEPGPVIGEDNLKALLEKLEGYAKEDTLFVLLDADGELFTQALAAGPDIIKPNRVELEQYAGMDYVASEQELLLIAKKLMESGIESVVVSMGKSGAMFLRPDLQVHCPGLRVKAHSTVGAGDAMVAALSYAWDNKLDATETVKLCMAVSAGAVTTIGTKPPTRAVVDELIGSVVMEEIQ